MTLTLTITKRSSNPNYEEELKKSGLNQYNNIQFQYNNPAPPSPFVDQNVLMCELTEAQFDQVKKAVLENW